jgi:hypothetical protein
MTEFDDDGKSTDPANPTAIDPNHPNYMHDPRYNRVRRMHAMSRGNVVVSPGGNPLTAGVQSEAMLASAPEAGL